MSYIGVPPFGQTVRTITELTATAGQTTFNISGGYLPGYIDVFLNGSSLGAADFTASNGSTVVLNVAAALNDEFKALAYWPVSLVDTYRKSEADTLLALKAPIASPSFTGLVTTAGKIKFPATQNASSDANTLDDYEEGTWTPSFSPGGFGTISNFTYTKIGRLVQVTGYLASPSGLGSGMVAIGGLPFAGNENFQMSMLWYNGVSSTIAAAYLPGGSTALQLRPVGGAPSTFTELSVQMTYITST